jgi:flagellar basal-body rod modification protein FlgD
MGAAIAGIFNHALAAGQTLTGTSATPMASPATATADTSSTSSSDSATISANDFLTLLVTEMQNQDPTADVDPNEYINQLVNVNSLEQLIDINQNLTTALGVSSTPSGSSASTQTSGATSALTGASPAGTTAQTGAAARKAGVLAGAQSAASGAGTANSLSALSSAAKRAPGNLSVPDANPAAHRVAHALDGRSHAQSIAARVPGAQ